MQSASETPSSHLRAQSCPADQRGVGCGCDRRANPGTKGRRPARVPAARDRPAGYHERRRDSPAFGPKLQVRPLPTRVCFLSQSGRNGRRRDRLLLADSARQGRPASSHDCCLGDPQWRWTNPAGPARISLRNSRGISERQHLQCGSRLAYATPGVGFKNDPRPGGELLRRFVLTNRGPQLRAFSIGEGDSFWSKSPSSGIFLIMKTKPDDNDTVDSSQTASGFSY